MWGYECISGVKISKTESAAAGDKMAMRMMANKGTYSLASTNHREGLAFLPFQNQNSGFDLGMTF
jgi:hypothetical protein